VRKLDASRLPSSAAKDAANWIRGECNQAGYADLRPKIGIILGSGLNDLLQYMDVKQRFSYNQIPYFAPTTVSGHAGKLELGYSNGQQIAVLRGRYHFYEGHSPERLIHPVRMLHELGVEMLLVTNAAGGLNPNYRQGDLMLMRDHIGLPTLSGYNPLIGPNDDDLGPRFPPMGAAYDPELLNCLRMVATNANMNVQEGVYVMVSGPTYETPAEMRALRILGADAVGMSTVPEVIAARHVGMKVAGISCITNTATPETAESVNHEEVLVGAAATLPKLERLIREFLNTVAVKKFPQSITESHPFADVLPDNYPPSDTTDATTLPISPSSIINFTEKKRL